MYEFKFIRKNIEQLKEIEKKWIKKAEIKSMGANWKQTSLVWK